MFPTEAYLIAFLVLVVSVALAHAMWPELGDEYKMIAPLLCLMATLAAFITVSEVWWMVLIHRASAGA